MLFSKRAVTLSLLTLLAGCGDAPVPGINGGSTLIDTGDAAFEFDAGVGSDAALADVAPTDVEPADASDTTTAGDAPVDASDDTAAADDTADDAAADTDGNEDADADAGDAEDAVEDAADDAVDDVVDAAPDTPFTSPYELGPYGTQRFDESASIPLGGGRRDMDVRLYVPTDTSGAPYPVVVFSHGFQLNGEGYNTFGDRMASHGIVGVFPSYGDGLIQALTHVELAELVSGWIDWVEDESDRGGSRLNAVADPNRVGAAGHSRGGKQSILAAIEDPRIAAVFGVDPVDSGPPFGSNPVDYPSVAPERMSELVVPSAFLGAGLGGEGAFGGISPACAPTDDNYSAYYNAASSPSFEYLVEDSGHLDYTDDCGLICITCPSAGDAGNNRSFATATLIAFFGVYLAEDERYRPWLDGDEVTSGAPTVTFRSR